MHFLIISPVIHKKDEKGYAGYAPYIKEMNLWLKYVDKVTILAPVTHATPDPLESQYVHNNLNFVALPSFNTTTIAATIKTIAILPVIIVKMIYHMRKADHLHLRCPSNMGLLACLCQILFPAKPKTVKYANNWDPESAQPLSYKLQQAILRSTRFTRNARVLVYGDWNESSRNIHPFYTASYFKNMQLPVAPRRLATDDCIKLLFVGTLTPNKRPLLTLEIAQILFKAGYNIELNLLGDGNQRQELQQLINDNQMSQNVVLRGKVHPDEAIEYFKEAHFLVFLSMSEGWPKVVAESMWWGCLPVTTKVSCVAQMIGNGSRGVLVQPDATQVTNAIISMINNPEKYTQMCLEAIEWSRQYYLEKFEEDIATFI